MNVTKEQVEHLKETVKPLLDSTVTELKITTFGNDCALEVNCESELSLSMHRLLHALGYTHGVPIIVIRKDSDIKTLL